MMINSQPESINPTAVVVDIKTAMQKINRSSRTKKKQQRSNRLSGLLACIRAHRTELSVVTLLLVAILIAIASVSVITPRTTIHTGSHQEHVEQKVSITFDIANDCGLNADAVMNENNNTMISGLTDAIHKIASLALNDNMSDTTNRISSVKINRVLDIETDCESGKNCLLFVASISLVGDTDRLKSAVSDGVIASFKDGSFSASVPEHALACSD